MPVTTPRSLHRYSSVLARTFGMFALALVAHPATSASTCPLAAAPTATQNAPSHAAPEDSSCLVGAKAVRASDEVYDLRSRSEYLEFHIPEARHSNAAELSRILRGSDKAVVVYDSGKFRSDAFLLCSRLRSNGFRNFRVIDGGIAAWAQAHRRPERLTVSRLSDAEVSAALSDPRNSALALDDALRPVLSEHRIRQTSSAGSGRRVIVADTTTPAEKINASLDGSGSAAAFYWIGSRDRLVTLIHSHLAQDQKRVAGPGQSATCSTL